MILILYIHSSVSTVHWVHTNNVLRELDIVLQDGSLLILMPLKSCQASVVLFLWSMSVKILSLAQPADFPLKPHTDEGHKKILFVLLLDTF